MSVFEESCGFIVRKISVFEESCGFLMECFKDFKSVQKK